MRQAGRTFYPQTFEELWLETLDGLRNQAAAVRTYGDGWKLEEDLEYELGCARGFVREITREVQSAKRMVLRYRDDDWSHPAEYLARKQADLAFMRSIRDELTAGLRTWKRLDREHQRELAKVCEELRREREEREGSSHV